MTNKTIILLIILMAVIGLSGMASANIPRNMHKDDCYDKKRDNKQVDIVKKGSKDKCNDKKDEDDDCNNNIPGTVHGHFAPSGDRPGGEKGKCNDKKNEDDDKCNNIPGAVQVQTAKSDKVCGHRAPGPVP